MMTNAGPRGDTHMRKRLGRAHVETKTVRESMLHGVSPYKHPARN